METATLQEHKDLIPMNFKAIFLDIFLASINFVFGIITLENINYVVAWLSLGSLVFRISSVAFKRYKFVLIPFFEIWAYLKATPEQRQRFIEMWKKEQKEDSKNTSLDEEIGDLKNLTK